MSAAPCTVIANEIWLLMVDAQNATLRTDSSLFQRTTSWAWNIDDSQTVVSECSKTFEFKRTCLGVGVCLRRRRVVDANGLRPYLIHCKLYALPTVARATPSDGFFIHVVLLASRIRRCHAAIWAWLHATRLRAMGIAAGKRWAATSL